MLFSEGMCFFKKPKPMPRAMVISAPIPQKYDIPNGVLPPYHQTYEVHTITAIPLPPPKVYHTKDPMPPPRAPPGLFNDYWEYGNRTQPAVAAPVSVPAAPRMRPHPVPPVPNMEQPAAAPPIATGRKGSLAHVVRGRKPSHFPGGGERGAKRTLFRNAGLDERGRLKLEYVEVGDDGDEWETPDEYYSRAAKKAAKRRGQWSDNY